MTQQITLGSGLTLAVPEAHRGAYYLRWWRRLVDTPLPEREEVWQQMPARCLWTWEPASPTGLTFRQTLAVVARDVQGDPPPWNDPHPEMADPYRSQMEIDYHLLPADLETVTGALESHQDPGHPDYLWGQELDLAEVGSWVVATGCRLTARALEMEMLELTECLLAATDCHWNGLVADRDCLLQCTECTVDYLTDHGQIGPESGLTVTGYYQSRGFSYDDQRPGLAVPILEGRCPGRCHHWIVHGSGLPDENTHQTRLLTTLSDDQPTHYRWEEGWVPLGDQPLPEMDGMRWWPELADHLLSPPPVLVLDHRVRLPELWSSRYQLWSRSPRRSLYRRCGRAKSARS